MKRFVWAFALLAILALVGIPAMAQDQNIVEIAASNAAFSTLVTAVEAAGLVETLSGEGPFTVFAPTNAAFEALGADTIEAVLADTDLLTSILTYHVVAGSLDSAAVAGSTELTSVQGAPISVSVVDGSVFLNETTQIVTTDIQASNGVIHVIDSVLLPPTGDEAAPEAEPVAEEMVHIRVAHFSPDTPAVDVYVNGELSAVQGLEFPSITEWIALPAGSYNLAVSPAGTSLDDAAIGPADFDLPAGAWLTIAAVGSLEAGTLAPAILAEDFSPIAEGNTRVTVFHAIEGAPAVDVLSNGTAVVTQLGFPGTLGDNDGAFTIDGPAGAYDIAVNATGTSTAILDLPGTQFDAGINYLVAAVGTADSPQVALAATDVAAMMAPPAEEAAPEVDATPEATAEAAAEEESQAAGTIVDIAAGNPDFSTLVTAVEAAGLVETLSGEGPFTVFAPTNAAFEALGADTIEAVLADTDLLTSILTYHVVAGKYPAAVVSGLLQLQSVEGSPISISVVDGKVFLNDTVEIVMTDIEASNGVIHVISAVLMPPTE